MWTDAVGVKLNDVLITFVNITHADDAAIVFQVVFSGEEPTAIVGVDAVAVEMAIDVAFKSMQYFTCFTIQDQ